MHRQAKTVTTVEELDALVKKEDIKILVAFEKSGALRDELHKRSRRAISADQQESDTPGLHFRGDVRVAVAVQHWDIIYFVGPNCYNHISCDDYLSMKMQDHRAWWAVAMVLWCLCCNHCMALLIEQPTATQAEKYIQASTLPGVEVVEFNTSAYGDPSPGKGMRFTTINLDWERPHASPRATSKAPQEARSQTAYSDCVDRDHMRSTFRHYPLMVSKLACARVRTAELVEFPDYATQVQLLKGRWPITPPKDYSNLDAQPTKHEDRVFSQRRGDGTGKLEDYAARRAWPGQGTIVAKPVTKFLERKERQGNITQAQKAALSEARAAPATLQPVSAEDYEAACARQQNGTATDADTVTLSHAQSRGVTPKKAIKQVAWAASAQMIGTAQAEDINTDEDIFVPEEDEVDLTDGMEVSVPPDENAGAAYALSTMDSTATATEGTPPSYPGLFVTNYEPDLALTVFMLCMGRTEPLVLMSTEDEAVIAPPVPLGASKVQTAEEHVSSVLKDGKETMGFRFGTKAKSQLVAVPVECDRISAPIATSLAKRRSLRTLGWMAIWCTLGALEPMAEVSTVASLGVASMGQFMSRDGSATSLMTLERDLRDATHFAAGMAGPMGPIRAQADHNDAVTPRQLIPRARQGLEELKQGLAGTQYRDWIDVVQPLHLSEVPPDLLDAELPINDASLDKLLFAPRLPIYETTWLDRQPKQWLPQREECKDFGAKRAMDLLLPEGVAICEEWFAGQLEDLKCLEKHGTECHRKHKVTKVVGQSLFHPCARGYVYDCRGGTCEPLDYEQPLRTKFNMNALRARLQDYPDQRLASNVLEGIRFEADVELHMVLTAHLHSIDEGFQSVQKTLRELSSMGFYDFFSAVPFMPMIIVGQGSNWKKPGEDGVRKARRTSNFSGPHDEIRDQDGKAVTSINAASKSYNVPDWISMSDNPALRLWNEHRYAHIPEAARATGNVRWKFPKEMKPQLDQVMQDGYIFLRETNTRGVALIVWVADASFYFNQVSCRVTHPPTPCTHDECPWESGGALYTLNMTKCPLGQSQGEPFTLSHAWPSNDESPRGRSQGEPFTLST